MSHQCCVRGCKTRASQDKNLHAFPKTGERKRQWLHNIREDETGSFKVTKDTRICSKHFNADDYRVVKDSRGRTTKEKSLKENACPSVFPWSNEKKERRTSVSKACREREESEGDKSEEHPPKRRRRSTKSSVNNEQDNTKTQSEVKPENSEGADTSATETSENNPTEGNIEISPEQNKNEKTEVPQVVFQDSDVVDNEEDDGYVIISEQDLEGIGEGENEGSGETKLFEADEVPEFADMAEENAQGLIDVDAGCASDAPISLNGLVTL